MRELPGRGGKARRMVLAAAATAGLLAATAPTFASQDRAGGTIAGRIETCGIRLHVTATSSDGQVYRGMVGSTGRFKFEHLPPGTYRLTFDPGGEGSWTVENVVVRAGETVRPGVRSPHECVTICLLRIEAEGRG